MRYFRLALVLAVAISGSVSIFAMSSAGAATAVIAADSMTRTTPASWGVADTGGAYSVTRFAAFSVNGSYGLVKLNQPGEAQTASLTALSARDVEVRLSMAVKVLPVTGSDTYGSPTLRAKDGHGYRAQLRIAPLGAAYLTIARKDGSAASLIPLTQAIRLPQTVGAGAFINVAFSATGDTSVALTAKAWNVGTAEPDWQVSYIDSSTARVASAGAIQILSSTSSAPAELWYDNIKVTTSTTPNLAAAPSASSSSNTNGANALGDGAVASGQTGTEWFAAAGDVAPWAQFTFTATRRIASAQVFGPMANWVDPAGSIAPMHGLLTFSDGSSVKVSGIAGGGGSATTVAFAPRSVTWVRLALQKSNPQVKFGLREFSVYDVGTTPPRWPADPGVQHSAPAIPAVSCAVDTAPVGTSADTSPALVCPRPGTAVSGTTTVVVSAAPGTALTANAWLPGANAGSGGVVGVGSAVANTNGRAVFSIDATKLTTGPLGVRFATASASDRPLYVQLDNAGGLPRPADTIAPTGMTLQWNDDFTSPISVTKKGVGADYAATKPSYHGGGDFGDAIFADPTWGLNTIATVDNNFLRIRAQPTGAMVDPYGWGRTHVAGIISSSKVGGSGFSAQHGYFAARMLAPAGWGSWPAFWLLNSENAANRETAASEIDVTELYGQFPLGSCHSLHSWTTPVSSETKCPNPNGASDSALSWHTYAAWVKPDRVEYYIDNKLIATMLHPILTDEPFFFMLNLSLGGGWPIKIAGTGDTIDLYVDWVRVYT